MRYAFPPLRFLLQDLRDAIQEARCRGDCVLRLGNGHDRLRADAVIGDLLHFIRARQKPSERSIDARVVLRQPGEGAAQPG